MTDQTPQQQMDDIRQSVSQLNNAINILVTDFLQPLTKQSVENQKAIAALVTRTDKIAEAINQHQAWLDEDRRDLAEHRQRQEEQSQQIQALIEENRRDRVETTRKFDETTRKFDEMQAEIRQNQRLLLAGQQRAEEQGQRLDTMIAEVLSLSKRVTTVEDAA